MTKILIPTIAATTIIALSLIVDPVFAPGPPKICEYIDDTNCTIAFSWDPADTSSDPNHLVVVSGSFTRSGLVSDSTNDVQGTIDGSLVGTLKTISETSKTNTAGSTTITTTVKAQSRNVNHLNGDVIIDGISYNVDIKTPGYESSQLSVQESVVSPSGSQTAEQERLSIPIIVTLCTTDQNCFQGFGTIHRESSQSSAGGFSVTFKTDVLEALVIGEDGLFELRMNKLERIVTTL